MFLGKSHNQTILDISQGDYIAVAAESFQIDRQAGKLSKHTIKFYQQFLKPFGKNYDAPLMHIQNATPDFLRRYFLAVAENHNPGVFSPARG
jgi:hypothetical protein